MAITYGFFNSVNGDRLYNAAQIGRYLQYIVGSGVFPYVSSSLQVLATDGMTVEVQPGRAMLDHHYMDNDAPITLMLNAGGAQDRIDGIIMYVDMTERACGITIKEGTPAASPKPPEMTRTDVRKEYMLAAVRVNKLASSITQSSISDTRADSSVCGWVTGLINQVDTSTLFVQWQTAYEEEYARTQEYLAAQQAAWQAFFDSVTHDNVLPAPALTQVGYVLTVNETGTGYVLTPSGTTDGTLSKSGQAADAAATGEAIKNAGVSNLLDNSDFTNPVNQTGFSGGAPSTDNAYFIDRWKTQQNTTKNIQVNLSDSGLIIHVPTGLAGIAQVIPKPKTGVTFAAKVNGKIEFVYSRHGVDESVKTNENVLLYVEWQDDALQVIIRNTGEDANEYTIEWAALYAGEYTADNLPAYQPKGYSAELAACSHYNPKTGNYATYSMVKAWGNASPGSSFAAQDITVDLAGADLVAITAKLGNTDALAGTNLFTARPGNRLNMMLAGTNGNVSLRAVNIGTAETNKISFNAGFNAGAQSNTHVIPLEIFIIKGVS